MNEEKRMKKKDNEEISDVNKWIKEVFIFF